MCKSIAKCRVARERSNKKNRYVAQNRSKGKNLSMKSMVPRNIRRQSMPTAGEGRVGVVIYREACAVILNSPELSQRKPFSL